VASSCKRTSAMRPERPVSQEPRRDWMLPVLGFLVVLVGGRLLVTGFDPAALVAAAALIVALLLVDWGELSG
jgi:hypothetical protein